MFQRAISPIALMGVLLFLAGGCSSKSKVDNLVLSLNQSNLQRLSNLYNMYQSQNNWTGPADMDELKEFVKNFPTNRLERMGIDVSDLDALFVSERDNKEYLLRPEVQGSAMGSVQPVLFEQDGVDGIWMVGFTSRTPQEVTSKSQYDDWFNGNWTEPAKQERGSPANRPTGN